MKTKKLIALLTALTMCAAAGCSSAEEDDLDETTTTKAADTAPEETASSTADIKTADSPAVEEAPKVTNLVNRKKRDVETPMGEEGTWTVFVYLCGADLESQGGAGSTDIAEMIQSSVNDNVKFVVQTGGASAWQLGVDPAATQRYVVENGDATCVYSEALVDMGESSSLEDFLSWGISEYPAANMGLVFWDHGSGSVNGVCFDENNESNSLLLKEIDAALYSVYDKMTEPFEFIGFDACLMSTAETAAVMATHARYMVASQECEPALGWNYTEIGNFMAENPSCTGAELGTKIVDSFYDHCATINSEDSATLAVTDLSKIDDFINAFNDYSKDIYDLTESGGYAPFARNVAKVDNYGGNNKASGYTNMIDIGGFIEAGSEYSGNAEKALKALNDTIVYKKNGKTHNVASGLAVYYPLEVQGSQELSIFKDIALNSYYLGLVDKIAYGAVNNTMNGYDNSGVIEGFANDWGKDSYEGSGESLTYSAGSSEEFNYAENFSAGQDKGSLTFAVDPAIDDEGNYGFTLSEETLANTGCVEAAVFMFNDEGSAMYEFGYSGEVSGDYETGEFSSLFDGYWFALSDGQYLAAYLEENCEGYDIYSSPIYLNGEETNLRFAYYYDDEEPSVEVIDIWDGIDENGTAGRSGKELKKGDKIIPRYYLFGLEDDSDDEGQLVDGAEYKFKGKNDLSFAQLENGIYMYAFVVNDIYGDYEVIDPVGITITDDGVQFFDTDDAEEGEE